MERILDLSNDDAKAHFLKASSYFNGDFPSYISFQPILTEVAAILDGKKLADFKSINPANLDGVNYRLTANKDGRFSWRPLELIHPAIYVQLVNIICEASNWSQIKHRMNEFEQGSSIVSCGSPVISSGRQSTQAAQVSNWWQAVEQKSIELSLVFTHLIHTDVTDCYGSLYTHSIPWALHGLEVGKSERRNKQLLGNQVDFWIQSSRYGQTNGVSQGSVLMDFIAELVLGWIDLEITKELGEAGDFQILRYRDDYRIFANSDTRAEAILKVISDRLRTVGMKLSTGKTIVSPNVVEGAIKPDKLAGIELQSLDITNAKTLQKQLLRLHAFGRRFPNSGALRRLLGGMHTKILQQTSPPDDLEVQIAIVTDIGATSPQAFPAIAGILSHLISLAPPDQKVLLWEKVRNKMRRVPYNGYLEIWLQRVMKPATVGASFDSNEKICQLVEGHEVQIWDSDWISNAALKAALNPAKMRTNDPASLNEVIAPNEIELFINNAYAY